MINCAFYCSDVCYFSRLSQWSGTPNDISSSLNYLRQNANRCHVDPPPPLIFQCCLLCPCPDLSIKYFPPIPFIAAFKERSKYNEQQTRSQYCCTPPSQQNGRQLFGQVTAELFLPLQFTPMCNSHYPNTPQNHARLFRLVSAGRPPPHVPRPPLRPPWRFARPP